jgi:hypothetical protein
MSLVYFLTLPTLSIQYVTGVLSDLVMSLLKSHGQGRESILCGEGLAGSTRQQEPKDIKKRRIKQTIRKNGGMKNKAIHYGR